MLNVIRAMYARPNSATSTYKRQEKKLQKRIDDFYADVFAMEAKNMKKAEKNG